MPARAVVCACKGTHLHTVAAVVAASMVEFWDGCHMMHPDATCTHNDRCQSPPPPPAFQAHPAIHPAVSPVVSPPARPPPAPPVRVCIVRRNCRQCGPLSWRCTCVSLCSGFHHLRLASATSPLRRSTPALWCLGAIQGTPGDFPGASISAACARAELPLLPRWVPGFLICT